MPPNTSALRRRSDLLQIAALVLSVLAALLLLVVPAFGGTSVTVDSDGTQAERTVTLLESEGPGILIPLAIPVLLTFVPLYPLGDARRWVRLACTLLLGAFTLLAILSIGVFYLPALVCSIAATTSTMSEHRSTTR